MKDFKKLVFGLLVLALSVLPAFGAMTRQDQTFYGNKTWEHKQTFTGDVQFDGAVLGLSQSGDVYYVNSDGGADSPGNYGTTWDAPFDTLDFAIGQCTANNGDIIYVLAGHAETIAAADGVDVDVAGVTIIGLGYGTDMPEFTFSATGSEFVIGAASVTVANLRFIAGISAITMGISIEAAGDEFYMYGCIFPKPTTNSWEFLDTIDVADGANGITIEKCIAFNDEGGAAPNHFIEAGNGSAGPERLRVVGNYIKGDFAVSAIWSDEPCDEAYIADNVIINHTSGQHCIELADAGTGAVENNRLYGDTIGAILDPGSLFNYNNFISTAIDVAAVPLHLQETAAKILAGLRMAGTPVGSVLYVDNATGSDSDTGATWSLAEATVDAAIGDCTADKGDVIFLAPDHEETLVDAQITADVAGIRIIGLGGHEQMPMITLNHANASLDISAQVWIENIEFYVTTDSNIAIDVNISDVTIKGCKFTASGAGHVVGIDLATTLSDITIIDNFVYQTDTDGTSFIASAAGAVTNLVVKNNRVWGDYDNACIYSDQVNVNALIEDNILNNVQSGDHAIEISGATTGVLRDNFCTSATYLNTIDPGSLAMSGNRISVGVDAASVAFPQFEDGALRSVVKTDGAVLTGDDDLFVITGGPIKNAKIIGIVTTVLGGAANGDLQIDVTEPAATVDLNAAPVAVDNDAAGTMYMNIDSTSVFTPITNGASIIDPVDAPEAYFNLPVGTVIFRSSAAQSGVIEWTMTFEAGPGVTVTAAP